MIVDANNWQKRRMCNMDMPHAIEITSYCMILPGKTSKHKIQVGRKVVRSDIYGLVILILWMCWVKSRGLGQVDVLGKTGADMLAQTLAEKCPRLRQVALSNLRPIACEKTAQF